MITLPLPPSTNQLFRNVPRVGRVKTTAYKKWQQAAGLMLNVQRPEPIKGSASVFITVPEKMRGDIDNRIKAILDLFVMRGIIQDDRFITEITICRADTCEPKTCRVRLFASERKAA